MGFKSDDIAPLDPTRKIGEETSPGGKMPSKSFEQFMEAAAQKPSGKSQPLNASPFDIMHSRTPLATGPTFDTLLNQTKSAHSMLGDISTQLNTKNLKLKQSQRYLLRNKLGDANAHLRAANAKMGVEAPVATTSGSGGILGKFLDLVNESQSNVMAAQQHLLNMKSKGVDLKPADFLMIQLKLAHAQQEIEYASIMLSKAVDDMKMLFNVQL